MESLKKREIRAQLIIEMSKTSVDEVVAKINDEPALIDFLWDLIKEQEYPVSNRAAWAMIHVFENYPDKVKPLKDEMASLLPLLKGEDQIVQPIMRSLLKILSEQELPEEHIGILCKLCFEWVEKVDMPAAIRVYAMDILYAISVKEPEIKPELMAILEHEIPRGTPGFQNRGKKVFKKLAREVFLKD